MDFRLAAMRDLSQLKEMYKQIIKNMNEHDIQIWDDIYPCEFFEEDIKNNRLYVLFNSGEMISAFVVCDNDPGEKAVQWHDNHAKALYINRLGVNIKYSQKGTGSYMLARAKEVAKGSGAEYLRLFVADINEPAIKFYIRNGFEKVDGAYDEVFDDGFMLHEYGYEIKV